MRLTTTSYTILNSVQLLNQTKCWFSERGENQSTRRKTSRSRVEKQQIQPNSDAEFDGRKVSVLTTAPELLHIQFNLFST